MELFLAFDFNWMLEVFQDKRRENMARRIFAVFFITVLEEVLQTSTKKGVKLRIHFGFFKFELATLALGLILIGFFPLSLFGSVFCSKLLQSFGCILVKISLHLNHLVKLRTNQLFEIICQCSQQGASCLFD